MADPAGFERAADGLRLLERETPGGWDVNPWRGILGLPRRVWLLCGCTLVNRMGTMAFPLLTLYLVQGLGWAPRKAGTVLLGYGIGSLVSAPLAGLVADRVGHGRVLRVSLWGSGVLLMLLPLVKHPAGLLGLVVLWAALTQAFWPSSMALLAGLAGPGQRRAVFALHRAVSNLGMAVGPALGGVIAMVSFSWVFWTDGITTLVSAGLLTLFLFLEREVDRPPGRDQDGGSGAWRDPRLLSLLLGFLPVLLVFWQVGGILPLYVVRDLGCTTRFFGLIFTVNTLLIVALEVPLNVAMARCPHGRQLVLGSLLVAAGFGLVGLARGHGAILACAVIWTFGEMILFPTTADAVAALAPGHRRGEYMGLYSLAFAAASALGPWLGLTVYALAGPGPAWGACFLLGCVGAAALGRFRVEQDRARPSA
jgi:predicted MFS family arabinose efflux permease